MAMKDGVGPERRRTGGKLHDDVRSDHRAKDRDILLGFHAKIDDDQRIGLASRSYNAPEQKSHSADENSSQVTPRKNTDKLRCHSERRAVTRVAARSRGIVASTARVASIPRSARNDRRSEEHT